MCFTPPVGNIFQCLDVVGRVFRTRINHTLARLIADDITNVCYKQIARAIIS